MKIQSVPTSKVTPYANNARQIPPEAISKVAASIKEFGWQQPIVVDKDFVIIAGHTRLLAAQQLELDKVPVYVATELNDAQAKQYRLLDNRSHQESRWDLDILKLELVGMNDAGIDLNMTGFDPDELQDYMGMVEFEPGSEEEQGDLDKKEPITCPKCGHEFEA